MYFECNTQNCILQKIYWEKIHNLFLLHYYLFWKVFSAAAETWSNFILYFLQHIFKIKSFPIQRTDQLPFQPICKCYKNMVINSRRFFKWYFHLPKISIIQLAINADSLCMYYFNIFVALACGSKQLADSKLVIQKCGNWC